MNQRRIIFFLLLIILLPNLNVFSAGAEEITNSTSSSEKPNQSIEDSMKLNEIANPAETDKRKVD